MFVLDLVVGFVSFNIGNKFVFKKKFEFLCGWNKYVKLKFIKEEKS